MVATVIAMFISIGAMTAFLAQSKIIYHSGKNDQSWQEGVSSFDMISDLLMQSQMCLYSCSTPIPITITYPGGVLNPNTTLTQANDSIQIDFQIPSGFYIWPNDVSPFVKNAIRLNWDQASGQVTISSGASFSDNNRAPLSIAGGSTTKDYKVINLDLWPMVSVNGGIEPAASVNDKPTGGYLLTMIVRSASKDMSYKNKQDPVGLMKNYRTATYSRVIIPRNW